MRFRSLFVATVILAVVAGGCAVTGSNGQPTTQPVAGVDAAAVALVFEVALSDYSDLVAAGVIKDSSDVTFAMQVAQAAIAKYNAAPPGTPEANKLLLSANSAVMQFVLTKAQAKHPVVSPK